MVKKFSQAVAGLEDEIDAIIISGDLSDSGLNSSLRLALAYVQPVENISNYRGVLDAPLWRSGHTIHILPGNHDRFQKEQLSGAYSPRRPGGIGFESIFSSSDFWGDDDQRIGAVQVRYVPDPGGVAFVFADFCLRLDYEGDYWPSLGRGRVYSDVRERLELKTLEMQNRNIPVVWVIHFDPCQPEESDLALEEVSRLLQAAKKRNVKHVLCGHSHGMGWKRISIGDEEDALLVIRAGTATADRRIDEKVKIKRRRVPNSFSLLRFEFENGIIRHVESIPYTYDRSKGGRFKKRLELYRDWTLVED
jgi:3',5'-cyclic AMP phosphodiesterase CpdA